jgi:hypothetical protein
MFQRKEIEISSLRVRPNLEPRSKNRFAPDHTAIRLSARQLRLRPLMQ